MKRRVFIATLWSAAAGLDGSAAAAELGPKQVALLALRVLAYDRKLKARSDGKAAPIVILYLEGNSSSETLQIDLVNTLEDLAGSVNILGLPVRVSALAYKDPGALEARLFALRPVALFVCPGLSDALPAISALTRKRSVLSVTVNADYLKSGLSIGLINNEERINLVINLPASRAEGADLDASLLRIAAVYR